MMETQRLIQYTTTKRSNKDRQLPLGDHWGRVVHCDVALEVSLDATQAAESR